MAEVQTRVSCLIEYSTANQQHPTSKSYFNLETRFISKSSSNRLMIFISTVIVQNFYVIKILDFYEGFLSADGNNIQIKSKQNHKSEL